jgi:hypothetical protein
LVGTTTSTLWDKNVVSNITLVNNENETVKWGRNHLMINCDKKCRMSKIIPLLDKLMISNDFLLRVFGLSNYKLPSTRAMGL